ncbi:MAG: dihydroorotate dehydrogenase electron transfer subunit [Lachnospiraceae bacterium]|nr:dihydroorotate dehydrogenase electron transfer subunit [Lachnospiraceae bacterium]
MPNKFQEKGKILSQEKLAEGIYSIWFQTENIASHAKAGQFIAIYSNDNSRMLPRPISICEIDKEKERIRVVYRVVGAGTEEFSKAEAGDEFQIMGPLGNGYPSFEKDIMVIGGGIGLPPMLGLAESVKGNVTAVLGYRDNREFLREDFEKVAKVYVATEDGSDGTRGNVLDAIGENKLKADIICACGPTPMLRAIKEYALKNHIECYVSLEERMGCGIGACLACVCKSKDVDEHSHVHNKRVCKEGPVFRVEEVEF